MVDERVPAPKRRLSAHRRDLRRERIFGRLREGWAYDEVARDEGLTAERIRQIVREALEKRLLDEETDHAKLQLARLRPAMRIAAEAVADGHLKAIAPLIKALDRLDRYQQAAEANQVYDDEARRKLMAKINRVVENLEAEDERKRAKIAARAAQSQDFGESAGLREEKAKMPLGGRRKSLKRLDPDKEIKVNSFAFLWPGLAGFGQIWLNSALAWIVLGIRPRGSKPRSPAMALWRSRLWFRAPLSVGVAKCGAVSRVGIPLHRAEKALRSLFLGRAEHVGRRALLDDRPSSMKTTRSATSRAKRTSCVTTIMVMPASASRRMTASTSPTSSGSSADVGSSNSINRGGIASARAIATRCCWPPESRCGSLSACWLKPDAREQA